MVKDVEFVIYEYEVKKLEFFKEYYILLLVLEYVRGLIRKEW